VTYDPLVLSNRRSSLPELCTRLGRAVDRLDVRVSARAFRAVSGKLASADPGQLTEGLTGLAPALRRVAIGNGGQLARLVAAMVEAGADPLPILDVLGERVADGLERAGR
jgi:hypothetical protein